MREQTSSAGVPGDNGEGTLQEAFGLVCVFVHMTADGFANQRRVNLIPHKES